MAGAFRRAMDALYLLCVVVGCIALVLISAIIPWAVFTRYVALQPEEVGAADLARDAPGDGGVASPL